jgi:4-hydroxy-4-methyl-2-oxoglutarate aldolase
MSNPAQPEPLVSEPLLARARQVSAADLHEASGRLGALPDWIKPLSADVTLAGRAFPVYCGPGDNLPLHHAIYAASPGDVLVVNAGGRTPYGYWGDVMGTAAKVRGLGGLVITGGVRDSRSLVDMKFPVFCGAVSIRGTIKDPRGSHTVGEPIRIGGVAIERGDLVVGDADGVVIIPKNVAEIGVANAEQRVKTEATILKRLRDGATTLEVYGLPDLAPNRAQPNMAGRISIHPPGLSHGQLPIPAASRVGGIIATGGVRGVDPVSGVMPAELQEQARLMFSNLRTIVEAAGGRVEEILKITIWISTPEARQAINPPWLQMFPDAVSRPARHILHYELPAGMLMQCEALAVSRAAGAEVS